MKYKKYDLVAETTNAKLTNDINKYLKDGWDLYGFPMIHDGLFFQAIVKEEPDITGEVKEQQHDERTTTRK